MVNVTVAISYISNYMHVAMEHAHKYIVVYTARIPILLAVIKLTIYLNATIELSCMPIKL